MNFNAIKYWKKLGYTAIVGILIYAVSLIQDSKSNGENFGAWVLYGPLLIIYGVVFLTFLSASLYFSFAKNPNTDSDGSVSIKSNKQMVTFTAASILIIAYLIYFVYVSFIRPIFFGV